MAGRNRNTNIEKATGRRINSADIMIVLLFIVFVAGIILRFGLIEKVDKRAVDKTATVSFVIEGVSSSSVDFLSVGDEVAFSDGGMKIGQISSIDSAEPSIVYYHSDDGSIISYPSVDGKVDIKGTITVKGSLTDEGFMLDGTTYISPNMTLWTNTSKISVSMLVTNIEVNEK